MTDDQSVLSRRLLLTGGAAATVAAVVGLPALADVSPAPSAARLPTLADAVPARPAAYPLALRPQLLRQALAALDRHDSAVAHRDRIAIADYNAPSAQPRFHLIDLASGTMQTLRVAHGSGSDPDHSGWLKRFSNEPGSNASSEGAFVTADYYVGKHGRSQRLVGLDSTNNNALSRAIVIHSAWYANSDMIRTHGQLGRSQGCFTVAEADLDLLFARLGPGRMVFSAKV